MTKARDLANASTALSAVSATELGYLDGVTSAVQTQINTKQPTVANVSDTEIGYLDGVTSAIQTQLDAKAASSTSVSNAGGSTITVASGTTVPLTIQNNGTGNSLVVNDVASDTTPFVIDANGQVGIGGTAAANVKLAVIGGRTVARASNETYSLAVEYGTGGGQYYVGATNSATPDLVFSNVGGTERVRVTDSGNMGIGKTPSYKLDVDGTVNATAFTVGGAALTSGSMTQIVAPTSLGTGSSVTISSIPQTYKDLRIIIKDWSTVASAPAIRISFVDSGQYYAGWFIDYAGAITNVRSNSGRTYFEMGGALYFSALGSYIVNLYDYTNTTWKFGDFFLGGADGGSGADGCHFGAFRRSTSTGISTITLTASASTFDAGTYEIWGIK